MLGQRAAASAAAHLRDPRRPHRDRRPPGRRRPRRPRRGLELRRRHLRLRRRPAVLDGFDLTVEPGETVALVGRTGSGKSTVARLLPRFYDVDRGAVRIDGHDVRDLTVLSLRAPSASCSTSPSCSRSRSATTSPTAGPTPPTTRSRRGRRRPRPTSSSQALPDGYDTVVGERGYTLSGGQRQRIAIARTLLVNPRSWCSTTPPAPSTSTSRRIHGALRRCWPIARRSSSPTGCRPSPRRPGRAARGRPDRGRPAPTPS